jgi:preprotein translocase subunit SecA
MAQPRVPIRKIRRERDDTVPAIIDNILRAGEGKTLRKLRAVVTQVNSIEDDFKALSDAELRAMTDELRQRHADGESLDDLLPEAFATVREAAPRCTWATSPR